MIRLVVSALAVNGCHMQGTLACRLLSPPPDCLRTHPWPNGRRRTLLARREPTLQESWSHLQNPSFSSVFALQDAVVAAIAGTGSLDADLPVPEGTSPSDRKALIELAIRRRLLTLVEDEAAEAERFAVVDFAVQAAKGEHVSLSAPYVLLEDMVEHVTLNGCQG